MEKPIVDGLGHQIKHLQDDTHYTMIDRKYYTVALRPGEEEAIQPEFPELEEKYLEHKFNVHQTR